MQTVGGGVHDMWFIGSRPCNEQGNELDLVSGTGPINLGAGLIGDFSSADDQGFPWFVVEKTTSCSNLAELRERLAP